jgi:hypothetical protein
MRTGTTKDYDKVAMEPPTRPEVAAVLRELIQGERTRQSASAWASTWLLGDARVGDPAVWEALELLGAADLVSTDRPFLYDEEDFQASLGKLCVPA